ncbi:MAG: Sapep family Mn(2+)-dependent dipeptidase [Saccharofermentanales bacterium]
MNYKSMDDCSKEQSELVESLKGLIAIPSVKSEAKEGAPFGRETKKALKYILDEAGSMGFKTSELDGYAGYIEFGEGEKEIAILCHLDVVPAGEGWDFDPFEPFVENGRLFGRGSIDDKGPAIASLYAMKALKDSGYTPPCRIRLILGLDEESSCKCIAYYKSKEKNPDYGFTPDAKFPVIFAEKGILHITVGGHHEYNIDAMEPFILLSANGGERINMIPATCNVSYIENASDARIHGGRLPDPSMKIFKGVPGHAMMPEAGENAISKAMLEIGGILFKNDVSNRFVEFYNKFIGMTTDGSLLGIDFCDKDTGSLTFNVGLLELNADVDKVKAVQDTDKIAISYNIKMALDVRYPVTADVGFICSRIKECCSGYDLELLEVEDNLPLYVDKTSDFVQILLNIYNGMTDSDKVPLAIGGGTYARTMPNILAFGPCFSAQDDVAHQSGEYIKLDDLFLCKEIYQKAIVSLADFAVR